MAQNNTSQLREVVYAFLDNLPNQTVSLFLEKEAYGVRLTYICRDDAPQGVRAKGKPIEVLPATLHKIVYEETWDEMAHRAQSQGKESHYIKPDVDDGNSKWYLFHEGQGPTPLTTEGQHVISDEIQLKDGTWVPYSSTVSAQRATEKNQEIDAMLIDPPVAGS